MNAFRIDAPGYRLDRAGPGTWRISSPAGRVYLVEPQEGRCDCPDSRTRGHRRSCKHVRALRALLRLVPDLDAT